MMSSGQVLKHSDYKRQRNFTMNSSYFIQFTNKSVKNALKPTFQDKINQQIQNNRYRVQSTNYTPDKTMPCYAELSNSQFRATILHEKGIMNLRKSLLSDERTNTIPKKTLQNCIVENILQDGQIFMNNPVLLENVKKLKELRLLRKHEIHVNRYRGNGSINFVFNDIHERSTNPGFSRNNKGGFYTR